MARGCTFIDEIETQPITGANVRFHARADKDIQCFAMERATAIKVAYDILAAIDAADQRTGENVLPFGMAG